MTATTSSITVGPCPRSGLVSMDGDLMSNSIKTLQLKRLHNHLGKRRRRRSLVLCTSQANSQRAPMERHRDQPFEVQARQALANIIRDRGRSRSLGRDRMQK